MKLSYLTAMIAALAALAWFTPTSDFTRGLAVVVLAVAAVVEVRRLRRFREEARWAADASGRERP